MRQAKFTALNIKYGKLQAIIEQYYNDEFCDSILYENIFSPIKVFHVYDIIISISNNHLFNRRSYDNLRIIHQYYYFSIQR